MENNLDGCPLVASLRTFIGSLLGLDITSSSTRLLTTAQASVLLGMSQRWLYQYADRLPFTRRLGRTLRFDEAGLGLLDVPRQLHDLCKKFSSMVSPLCRDWV